MTKVETTVQSFNVGSGFTLRIPEQARCLFPPDKEEFQIISNAGIDNVWVSKSHSSGKLAHIHVTGTNWWTNLKAKPGVGATVVIEITKSHGGKIYRFA